MSEIKFNLIIIGLIVSLGIPAFMEPDHAALVFLYALSIYGLMVAMLIGILAGSKRRRKK